MTRSFDAVRLGLLATVLCAMLGLAASDARMSSHWCLIPHPLPRCVTYCSRPC